MFFLFEKKKKEGKYATTLLGYNLMEFELHIASLQRNIPKYNVYLGDKLGYFNQNMNNKIKSIFGLM